MGKSVTLSFGVWYLNFSAPSAGQLLSEDQLHRGSPDSNDELVVGLDKLHVLVTGGAGYIGSHAVLQLLEAGHTVTVIDNLSRGNSGALLLLSKAAEPDRYRFHQVDLGNKEAIRGVLLEEPRSDSAATSSRGQVSSKAASGDSLRTATDDGKQHRAARVLLPRVDLVIHFAAIAYVGESVAEPLLYYRNITVNTLNLLEVMSEAGIHKPVNPYGASKLMSEFMLRDHSATGAMRHVILRYFNVAGCDAQGRIGHSTRQATLLIKVACEHAVGKRSSLSIYGTDYPTPDGTGIRDYIHVDDLAAAHLRSLDHLRGNGESLTLNCGYGHGYSEFVDACKAVTGVAIKVTVQAEARAGDYAEMWADPAKINRDFGWRANYTDVTEGLTHAWAWRKQHPNGY
ncbi:MAG: hypothetical protein WDW38_010114 [Sanguina aurantia]